MGARAKLDPKKAELREERKKLLNGPNKACCLRGTTMTSTVPLDASFVQHVAAWPPLALLRPPPGLDLVSDTGPSVGCFGVRWVVRYGAQVA